MYGVPVWKLLMGPSRGTAGMLHLFVTTSVVCNEGTQNLLSYICKPFST